MLYLSHVVGCCVKYCGRNHDTLSSERSDCETGMLSVFSYSVQKYEQSFVHMFAYVYIHTYAYIHVLDIWVHR